MNPFFLLSVLLFCSLAVGAALVHRRIPRGRRCPGCAGGTIPLQPIVLPRPLARARILPGRRWCPRCRWEGLVYPNGRSRERGAAPRMELPRPPAGQGRTSEPEGGISGSSGASLPLRRIDLAGESWDVRLRCSMTGGLWWGQLLFVAPSGRVIPDPAPGLAAASLGAVVGRYIALPDPALRGRARELISE